MPKTALLALLYALLILLCPQAGIAGDNTPRDSDMNTIKLPVPDRENSLPLDRALAQRRSKRELGQALLSLSEAGQLLWAAQGITDPRGFRTAPSGGTLYPLELYLVTGEVEGLEPGVYRYLPQQHALKREANGECRRKLAKAALGQDYIRFNSAVVLIAAVYERTTGKYGKRGIRYVYIEVGHAAQNLYLEAEVLGFETVLVGAFDDDEVRQLLDLPKNEHPLALMPIGKDFYSSNCRFSVCPRIDRTTFST